MSILDEPGGIQWARRIASRIWCDEEFKFHTMNAPGAEAIAYIILIIHDAEKGVVNSRRKKMLIEEINGELSEIKINPFARVE